MTLVDDYAHHPAEIEATIAAAREAFPGRRLRALFQPHLVSRTRHLAGELAAALAAADDIVVTDVYLAREEPDAAVTGKLVVDALSDLGRLAAWIPGVEDAAAYLARRARAGRRAARARRRERRCGARADPRAARRGGRRSVIAHRGGGRALALHDDRNRRAGTLARHGPRRSRSSSRCSAGRPQRGAPVEAVGLGSNLLVADEGFDGLVVKLAGRARGRARSTARRSSRAAARRMPSACIAPGRPGSAASSSHRRFPGTAGGGVRMNAGAYGSDWRSVLVDAVVVGPDGTRTLGLDELDLSLPSLRARARRDRRARALPADAEADPTRSRPRSPSCSRSGRRRSRRTSARSAASSRTRTRARGRAP